MTPRLRTLIEHASRPAETDAVLLRRFADARDPQAFAELVRRYGRLVWGQCRHLLHNEADADDAFQATFLSLAACDRTLRDTNKLGPWLHGVAYRVCQQVKRTAARRAKREKATAKAEATRPVPDSAWDTAFAAVHDELAKLPDTLRVPFVLCVLEGKGTSEAATQLGLKLGTLSARLSRAKQTLLERLTARGLTAGLAAVGVVAVGAASVPAAVVGRACDIAAGGAVPPDILSLSHGVLNVVTLSARRWAMAAVLACGLAAGGAGVWQANAQEKPGSTFKPPAADGRKRQEAVRPVPDAAKAAAEKPTPPPAKPLPVFKYDIKGAEYAPTTTEFERAVKDGEADGSTFAGVVTFAGFTERQGKGPVQALVFRRTPAKAAKAEVKWLEKAAQPTPATDAEKTLQAQIERLTKELTDLKAKAAEPGKPAERTKAVFAAADFNGDLEIADALLTALVRTKYGPAVAKTLVIEQRNNQTVSVEGPSKEQLQWLVDTVKLLATAKPPAR